MSKKIKNIVIKILQFIVYAFVIYFIYGRLSGNISKISKENLEFEILPLILSILLYAAHDLWNGLNWYYLIDEHDNPKVTIPNQISVYLKSHVLRYIPGNVVGIFSRAVYNKKYDVKMIKSLWGWFIENIIYLVIGLSIGCALIPALAEEVEFSISPYWIFAALIIGFVIFFLNGTFSFIFEKFIVPRLPKKFDNEYGVLNINFKQKLLLLVRYSVSWVLFSGSFLLFIASLYDFSRGDILALIAVNALSWGIGYLSIITPSGTGVREVVMITLLTSILEFSDSKAVVIGIGARLVIMISELVAFGIYFLANSIIAKRNLAKN